VQLVVIVDKLHVAGLQLHLRNAGLIVGERIKQNRALDSAVVQAHRVRKRCALSIYWALVETPLGPSCQLSGGFSK